MDVIDKNYRIVKPLGGGGFSEVFLVEGPSGLCALKLLKGDLLSLKKTTLEEFRNEFAILKDMRHPNISGILDFGFDSDEGRYYYTSEYIDGVDFAKATAGMEPGQITDLVVEALRALGYLHSYGIHHFDIKGANVLVVGQDDPCVKIIDFGLAGFDPRGKIIGTPSYMPPEIASREPADGRADIYSLGVLWYTSLARVNPFRGANSQETISRQLSLVPPPPSAQNPKVPDWLDSVVMRMLEKNPANRYRGAEAVLRDINRLGPKRYKMETRETLLSYLPDEGRFIGREKEISLLEDAAGRLRSEEGGAFACWLVSGAPGTGRSRLIKELKYRLQLKDIRVVFASASEEEAFSSWCDSLGEQIARGQSMAAFMLDDADAVAGDDALSGRLQALLYGARRPGRNSRVMIVLAQGGDREDAITTLAAASTNRIDLSSFSAGELCAYVVSLTGLEDPPKELLEGILRRTEGNPFFVTEVIRSLIAGGGLFDEHGRWKASLFEDLGVDFSKAIVSDTVGDLLLSRAAGLQKDERSLLEALAVYGSPASSADLGAWADVQSPSEKLLILVRLGILRRDEGLAFNFRNELMGQAVAGKLPDERRKRLHDRMASSLEEAGASRESVLRHRSLGSNARLACTAALELGELSLKGSRAREARAHLSLALKLADRNDSELVTGIQMKLGEASLIGHDYEDARRRFAAVESFVAKDSKDLRSASWRADALLRLGATYIKLQEPGRARVAFEDADEALKSMGGDLRRELTIENFTGALLFQEGKLKEAREIFERTRDRWPSLSQEDKAKVSNNDLGMVLVSAGELKAAGEVLQNDLARAEELGDGMLIGRAHYNLAQLFLASQDFGGAISSYLKCAEVCKRTGNTELMLRAWNGLGNSYQMTGDFVQSISYYERGLELHERAGDLRGGAAIAVNLGIVETARGNLEAALDRLVPAVEYLRALVQKSATDWAALARGLLEIGDVLRRKGKNAAARVALEEAQGIASRVRKAAGLRFWILATMAEAALSEGDIHKAGELVEMLRPLAAGEQEKNKAAELSAAVRRSVCEPERAETNDEVKAEDRGMNAGGGLETRSYRRILEINKLIAAEADLDYVLKTVLFYALELTEAEAGAVLLIGEDGKLKVSCSRNMAGDEAETAFSATVAERAVSSGKAVSCDDAVNDSRFSSEASVAAHSLRSVLCLPVAARGRVIGALYLDHRLQTGAFAAADMVILEAFSDQVGLAIETARKLESGVRKEEDLRMELSEASRRVERYEELLKERAQYEGLDLGPIVGKSEGMARVVRTISKISDTDISVFLCGETGTGKELIARALHSNHPSRKSKRFVAINCGAIPAALVESELFGYKAGAFTGAARDKRGLVEEADGGTLFLDEVGELDQQLQVKLLRVLQEREFTRVGDTAPIPVDVRVIAASNRDIEGMVKEGIFREDLYYRICQMRIDVPPLRERPEDLAVLAPRFLKEAAPDRNVSISPRLMRRMMSYGWPGNVRELVNTMQVAAALAEGDVVDESAIPENHPMSKPAAVASVQRGAKSIEKAPERLQSEKEGREEIDGSNFYDASNSWKDYERVITAKCYEANDFRARPAAEELGVSIATLYNRIKEWGLEDRSAAVYSDPFAYRRNTRIEDYLPLVFSAALRAANGRASFAIANLRVSQGYFYKVMKRAKG